MTYRILRVLCEKFRLSEDFDFKILAKKTRGLVRSDLLDLTSSAYFMAAERSLETTLESTNSLEKAVVTQSDDLGTMKVGQGQFASPPTQVAVTLRSGSRDSIKRFDKAYADGLFKMPLDQISITVPDFLTALPKILPICQRTGFATAPDVTWADIGALGSLKVAMQKAIVQPIKEPEPLTSLGHVTMTGTLLWGPRGCGKTMLAKAFASEIGANFLRVKSTGCVYQVRILLPIFEIPKLLTDQHSTPGNQSGLFVKFSLEPELVPRVLSFLINWMP